jgi:hypothetical protein
MSIQAAMLPDGKRLHLQHGPIDLIIALTVMRLKCAAPGWPRVPGLKPC